MAMKMSSYFKSWFKKYEHELQAVVVNDKTGYNTSYGTPINFSGIIVSSSNAIGSMATSEQNYDISSAINVFYEHKYDTAMNAISIGDIIRFDGHDYMITAKLNSMLPNGTYDRKITARRDS